MLEIHRDQDGPITACEMLPAQETVQAIQAFRPATRWVGRWRPSRAADDGSAPAELDHAMCACLRVVAVGDVT